jgi:hypothetical protein
LVTHLNIKTTPLFKWSNDFNVNKIILKNKTKNDGKMSWSARVPSVGVSCTGYTRMERKSKNQSSIKTIKTQNINYMRKLILSIINLNIHILTKNPNQSYNSRPKTHFFFLLLLLCPSDWISLDLS